MIEVNLATVDLDLTRLDVERPAVDISAGSIDIILPAGTGNTNVTVDVTDIDTGRFLRNGGGYESTDYATTESRMNITINTSVGRTTGRPSGRGRNSEAAAWSRRERLLPLVLGEGKADLQSVLLALLVDLLDERPNVLGFLVCHGAGLLRRAGFTLNCTMTTRTSQGRSAAKAALRCDRLPVAGRLCRSRGESDAGWTRPQSETTELRVDVIRRLQPLLHCQRGYLRQRTGDKTASVLFFLGCFVFLVALCRG